MSLRDQAIIESITEEHTKLEPYGGINPNVNYCQLTTLRGRLSQQELMYIEQHGCPVCKKGRHSNSDSQFDHHALVQRVVLSYIESLLVQVQQSVLCATLHPIQARLARFLLTMQDRAGTDSFAFTQEFLSNVLGVNRSTLTGAAGALQANEIISYRRGRLSIRDRLGLERASCECYRVLRQEFARLLPFAGPGMHDRKRR